MTEGAETLLVSPHRFPDLAGERELAARHGLELVETESQEEFSAGMDRARLVMVTPYGNVGAAEIERATRCKAIVRYGTGVDNVDVEAATKQGIPVGYVPGAAVEEVAIHAVAMITGLARRLPIADRSVRAGDWTTNFTKGAQRFSEMTVGLLGIGRIGGKVADYINALEARVVAHDPYGEHPGVERVGFDELLETADILSLHVPLTDETRGIIGAKELERMKDGAALVNVSRGGLVDESALADALVRGKLGGAGIDVFSTEPLPVSSPLIAAPNTILSPHTAWRSEQSGHDYQTMALEQGRLALEGKRMTEMVNPAVYEGTPDAEGAAR